MAPPASRPSFLVRPSFFALTHGGCSLVAAAILAADAVRPGELKNTDFLFTMALWYVLYALGAFLLAWMRRRSPSMPAFTTSLYSFPFVCVALVALHVSFSEGCEGLLSLVREPYFWFLLANVLPGLATLARLLRALFLLLLRPFRPSRQSA
ncbi:MAG: hypothetical protein IK066_02775 [Kiritimatiellae bacterium]|nr:hypothetical protein [Kiritimatiellia bacterium]